MIIAIVLAAGQSKRFPGNKLLLELVPNKKLIDLIIEPLLESEVEKIVVVLGHEANKIEKEVLKFNSDRLVITINDNYLTGGMSSSILQGFNFALKTFNNLEAVMITPADIPYITTNVWNLLIKKFIDSFGLTPIIVPKYKKRKGHPILIGEKLFDELEKISESNMGLKEVINNHLDEITYVETGSQGILHDIDSIEDLKTMKETFNNIN